MTRGNPPIEQYKKHIINEVIQGKKKIAIAGTTYYRVTVYRRKRDKAEVLAYYDPTTNRGFRVEIISGRAKLVLMEQRKSNNERKRRRKDRSMEYPYPPPEKHLRELMRDPLVLLNYQNIIDMIAQNLNLPQNGYALTSEGIEIPILAFDGEYRALTGIIRDVARLFYPKDSSGAPLRVHYRVWGTFIAEDGRIIKGSLSIPSMLRLDRHGFNIDRYLSFIEKLASEIDVEPAELFILLMKNYLGISERYLQLLIAGVRRFDVDPAMVRRAIGLSCEKIELAIKKTSVSIVLRFGSIEILFLAVDSTAYSRFSKRDPLVVLEEIVDVFSGTARSVSIGDKPELEEPKIRFVVLLGDGEFFSEEFILTALIRGYIPVVRPRRDTPYAEKPKPFLVAYTVFFWRYLWWIYKLRAIVERVFAYLSKRGKLLSRSDSSARREVLSYVLARNVATCVSLGVLGGIVAVPL